MKIKVFYPNAKGNIELTKEKLEAILTEAYNEGYNDGKYYYNNGFYYNTLTTPYITTCTGSVSSCDCTSDIGIACAAKEYNENATTDCAFATLKTETIDGIKVEYVEATSED